MSTQSILFTAILVFVLMVIGLVLTMTEFTRVTDEPSKVKGPVDEE
ncbi:MAG: hypothetical protein R3192_14540 [Woeseiaceae bacterium]|nr:hypothetical protein [Woeseiaceae bacterium]